MRTLLLILFLIVIIYACDGDVIAELDSSSPSSVWSFAKSGRSERTILPLVRKIFGYSSKCGSRSCPSWKCQDDSAIIHGYCCHCPGWQNDRVPIPCYPDLKCPVFPEPLCSDYNFMMECCCTGP